MKDDVASIVEQVTEVGGLLDHVLSSVTGPGPDGTGQDACSVDEQLSELLVGLETVRNATEAAQAAVMVQMGARARAADQVAADSQGGSFWSRECREQFVPDEIGVLLGWTKMAAAARYGTACQVTDLPAVGQAWRAGVVDARKVATICDQLTPLTNTTDPADTGDHGDPGDLESVPARVQALAADAVDYATEPGRSRTAPQLREWLRRRVVEADPEAAEERRRQAMGDRRVVITPTDDGMSELWALLPSVQARQIQQALTAAAQGMTDDARSMDQRRADTMVDLLLGRAEPSPVSIGVIVPADTLAGASTEPGWVPGLGPVTPGQITELLGSGTGAETGTDAHAGAGAGSEGSGQGVRVGSQVVFRRLVTDPATGVLTDIAEDRYRPSAVLDQAVRARDVTCRFPGCRRSADSAGTDLDHTIPYPAGPTSASNLAVLCRRHHRLKHTAGWTVTLHSTGVMIWTTPTGRRYQTEPWRYADPDPPRLE